MIDFGLDPQQAAEMPRWTSNVPGQYANYPHGGPDVLTMERRFPEEVRREVREKMHEFAGRRLAVLSRRKRFRRAAWQR